MHTLALLLLISMAWAWNTFPDAYANGVNVYLEPSTPLIRKKATIGGDLFQTLRLEKDSKLVVQIVPFGLNASNQIMVSLAGAGNPSIRIGNQTTIYTFSSPATKGYALSMSNVNGIGSTIESH